MTPVARGYRRTPAVTQLRAQAPVFSLVLSGSDLPLLGFKAQAGEPSQVVPF